MDSQNVVRSGELFLLWAALNRVEVNTGAFIAAHLYDQATHSHTHLAGGGIITAIASALGFTDHIRLLPELRTHTRMDHRFCVSIGMFEQVGMSAWVVVNGVRWFRLPNRDKTTLSNPANLVLGSQHREDPDAAGRADSPIDLDADEPFVSPDPTSSHAARALQFPSPSSRPSTSGAGPSQPAGASSDYMAEIISRLDRLQTNQEYLSGQIHDLSVQAADNSERLHDVVARQDRMEYWFYYAYDYAHIPRPPPGWQPPPPDDY